MRAALGDANTRKMLSPGFLANLVNQVVLNKLRSKNNFTYPDCLKEGALFVYVLVGPLAYNVLSINFEGGLPSLSTVRRLLASKPALEIGHFRFDYIKSQMESKGEPLFVVCAEDDTKISERLRYDWKNDSVIGLQMPLSEDGVPTHGSFHFTSLRAVQGYIDDNPMATYAKLMTVRSVSADSTIYHLVIYGTKGSDKASEILSRWDFVYRSFAEIGINVMCKLGWQK